MAPEVSLGKLENNAGNSYIPPWTARAELPWAFGGVLGGFGVFFPINGISVGISKVASTRSGFGCCVPADSLGNRGFPTDSDRNRAPGRRNQREKRSSSPCRAFPGGFSRKNRSTTSIPRIPLGQGGKIPFLEVPGFSPLRFSFPGEEKIPAIFRTRMGLFGIFPGWRKFGIFPGLRKFPLLETGLAAGKESPFPTFLFQHSSRIRVGIPSWISWDLGIKN